MILKLRQKDVFFGVAVDSSKTSPHIISYMNHISQDPLFRAALARSWGHINGETQLIRSQRSDTLQSLPASFVPVTDGDAFASGWVQGFGWTYVPPCKDSSVCCECSDGSASAV